MLNMDSRLIDTSALIAVLQLIVNDDAANVIDETLVRITGREDAPRLFSDKEMRRLENRLKHAAANYDKLMAATYSIFKDAIEEQGLKLCSSFCEKEYA